MLSRFFFLFFSVLLLTYVQKSNANEYLSPTDICYFWNAKESICDRFQAWSDVNFYASNVNPTPYTYIVNIKPVIPIVLTDQLSIAQLWTSYGANNTQQFTVNIMGISGIEMFPWIKSKLLTTSLFQFDSSQSVTLAFEQSMLEFYVKNTPLEKSKCSGELISESANSIFNSFNAINFARKNKYPSYAFCPFIFAHANLNLIGFLEQIDAILIKKLWKFQPFNEKNNSISTINSSINVLDIVGYGFSLDTSLMHPFVFEKVAILNIVHSIGAIQTGLFKHFQKCKNIFFFLKSLKNFFHKIGIDWALTLANMSYTVFVSSGENADGWINGPDYFYPERDFCIFAHWSQVNYVFPVFDGTNLTDCTSTLLWLLLSHFAYELPNIYKMYPVTSRIFHICRDSNLHSREDLLLNATRYLENKASQCELFNDTGPTTIYAEYYQVEFIFEFVQDIFIYISIPCACLSGLFFNYLVIWTVKKNKEKELKDQFYQYMSLNSKFNCAYCLIFLLYPINSCVDSKTGYFCSLIRTSYVTQLYKIVFIEYFGESIKMCANVFYILIAVNRYMLIGQHHNSILKKISKWKMDWLIAVTVLTSLVLNVGHAFLYTLNNGNVYTEIFGAEYYSVYDTYPIINQRNTLSVSQYPLSIYLLVYFLTNSIIFWSVNTFVEVVMIRKLHTELIDKKKRLDGMNSTTSVSKFQKLVTSFRKSRKQQIEDGTEGRAILMVVVNALFNFFLRLPELFVVFSISYTLFGAKLNYLFNPFPSFSLFLTDLAYFCYILTFTTNFFVIYLFNQKFKQTFSEYTHAKQKI
jgi:hypothetical protein